MSFTVASVRRLCLPYLGLSYLADCHRRPPPPQRHPRPWAEDDEAQAGNRHQTRKSPAQTATGPL